jgi:hypothetical protein
VIADAITGQTRRNILRLLDLLQVKHKIIFSEDALDNMDRSRVKALDPDGLLLGHIKANPDKWTGGPGKGRNHDANGYQIRASYRSRTSPSLQVCVIEARGGQYDYVTELDLDEYSPDTAFLGHAAEVIRNKVTNGKTDPHKIARMLQKLEKHYDA